MGSACWAQQFYAQQPCLWKWGQSANPAPWGVLSPDLGTATFPTHAADPTMLHGHPKSTPITPPSTAKPSGASLLAEIKSRCLVVSEGVVTKSASAGRHTADCTRVPAIHQHHKRFSRRAADMVQAYVGSVHERQFQQHRCTPCAAAVWPFSQLLCQTRVFGLFRVEAPRCR
jgi:hypothetical protein